MSVMGQAGDSGVTGAKLPLHFGAPLDGGTQYHVSVPEPIRNQTNRIQFWPWAGCTELRAKRAGTATLANLINIFPRVFSSLC